MRALVIHLLLAAWIAPSIGCALAFLLTPLLTHEPMPRLDIVLFSIFGAPWITWLIFVPVGCCSYLFFRFAAIRRPKGLIFWEVAWCIIGVVSVIVFLLVIGAQFGPKDQGLASNFDSSHRSPADLLALIGLITGALIAPIHRWFWIQLYDEHYPGATPPVRLRP